MVDSYSLEGADLDIGGEYHKLIYDEVLTAQAKKIGKKHGAKVEVGSIGAKGEGEKSLMEEANRLQQEENTFINVPADTKKWSTETKVWTMRLTDKLKQASKAGMPYYVALPPLVIGAAAAQRTDAQRQQSKSDAQSMLAN